MQKKQNKKWLLQPQIPHSFNTRKNNQLENLAAATVKKIFFGSTEKYLKTVTASELN